jgi:tetratricopeptide (TPR) repeat protein
MKIVSGVLGVLLFLLVVKAEEKLASELSEVMLAKSQLHYIRGIEYLEKGKRYLNKALQEFKKAVKMNPYHIEAHIALASIYEEKEKFEKALEKYKTVYRLKPDYPLIHFYLGNVYVRLKKFQEAREEYEKEIVQNPYFADAHYNLGMIYYQNALYEKALAEFKATLQCNPKHLRAYKKLGDICWERGMFPEAEENYLKVLELSPKKVSGYLQLGWLYLEWGVLRENETERWHYFKKAQEQFQKGLKIAPNRLELQEILNVINEKSKKKPELTNQRAIKYFRKGERLFRRRRYRAAEIEYKCSIKHEPHFQNYNGLGNVHYMQGNYEEAHKCYLKSLVLNPEEKNTWYYLGLCYEAQKMTKKALLAYNRAKKEKGKEK